MHAHPKGSQEDGGKTNAGRNRVHRVVSGVSMWIVILIGLILVASLVVLVYLMVFELEDADLDREGARHGALAVSVQTYEASKEKDRAPITL